MKMLVVIVCYRAADLTIACLESLASEVESVPGTRVAVCENGTGGDSAKKLAEAIEANGWEDWVSLKVIHPNRGFAGGNNVILREALGGPDPPKYFLLLNADTIVRPGALGSLLEAIEPRLDIGIAGPRVEWPDGTPQETCYRFYNPLGEMCTAARTALVTRLLRRYCGRLPICDEPLEGDWISFACAMIRRQVVEQIGVLDDGFYLYYDDPDYCHRARRAGWRILYWPQAHVIHLRGRSNPVKQLSAERKRRPRYYYASRSRYFGKYYGRLGLLGTNILWTIGRCISFARELVGNKEPHTCEREWLDIWTNALDPLKMPSTAESRRA